MAYTLNNVTTQDNYADATTLLCPQTVRLRIQVYNNPIFYQLGRGAQGQDYSEGELFLGPVLASLDVICDTIRLRSAAPGAPAMVTLQALTEGDIPDLAAGR